MTVPAPVASVVIPTRNRVEELRALIRSALGQTVPVEVMVMDDGASPEVADMIQREFPQVRYHSLGTGRGPAFQRNRGIELATAPIVFPLDDDTVIVSPRTVAQTLAEFDHPRVAAVGIPFINIRLDQEVRHMFVEIPEGRSVQYAFQQNVARGGECSRVSRRADCIFGQSESESLGTIRQENTGCDSCADR